MADRQRRLRLSRRISGRGEGLLLYWERLERLRLRNN
jgi:hypothetical protein